MKVASPRDDDIDASAQIRHIKTAGCELAYLRSGTGQCLLLLHPLRTQREYFVPLMAALGPGFEFVVPDLPVHGRSSAPTVDYTAAYFADAVEQFIDVCDLQRVILIGESIGASIGLILAARQNPRLDRVVALNPYDYGLGGGIRRSSLLANVIFTTMLVPVLGPLVLGVGTKSIFRKIMEGGVYDPGHLPSDLVEELWASGKRPGHARAFLSLHRHWKTWIAARSMYPAVKTPVTLVYGDQDLSLPEDREANRKALTHVRCRSLDKCSHFSSLDDPGRIADIVREEVALVERTG